MDDALIWHRLQFAFTITASRLGSFGRRTAQFHATGPTVGSYIVSHRGKREQVPNSVRRGSDASTGFSPAEETE
jgi:hypothetical protein